MVKTIKSIHTKTSLKLFDNKIGIIPNLLHFLFDLLRSFFAIFKIKNAKSNKISSDLKSNGFGASTLVNIELLDSVSKKVAKLFDDKSKVSGELVSMGVLRLKLPVAEVPEIFELINDTLLSETLSSYFNSPYYLFRADIYRNFKSESKYSDSHVWHFDNAPRNLLKVMIYLTDVGEENGAICVVPRGVSRKFKLKGYWDRNSSKSKSLVSEIDKNKVEMLGLKGSCIFFTPQFCLHRAGKPRKNFRDVIVLSFYPSLDKSNTIISDEVDRNAGYLVNPFTKKPLKTGVGLT